MDSRKRRLGVGGIQRKKKMSEVEKTLRPPTGRPKPSCAPRKSTPSFNRPTVPARGKDNIVKPNAPSAAASASMRPPSKPEIKKDALLIDQYMDKAIEKVLISLDRRNARRKEAFVTAIASKKTRVVVVESPKGCGGEQLVCAWLASLKKIPMIRSIVMADREMGTTDLICAAGGTSQKSRDKRVLVLTDLEQSRVKMLADLEKTLDKIVVVVSDAFDKGLRSALFGDTRSTVVLLTCSADELARAAELALPRGVVAGGYAKLKTEAMMCDGNMSALLSRIDGGIAGTKMDKRFDLFSEAARALTSGKSEGIRYDGDEARNTIWAATPVVADVFPQRTNKDALNSLDAMVQALDDHSLGDMISNQGWRSGSGILNAYADEIATRTLNTNRERVKIRRLMDNPKSFYKGMGKQVREFNAAKRHEFQAPPRPHMLLAGAGAQDIPLTESIARFKWVYTPVHGDPTTDAIAAAAAAIASTPKWALGPSNKGFKMIPPPQLDHPQEMAAWFGQRYPEATTLSAEPWWPGVWGAILAGVGKECFRPDVYVKEILNAAAKIAQDLRPPPPYEECVAPQGPGAELTTLDRRFPEAMRAYLRRVEV